MPGIEEWRERFLFDFWQEREEIRAARALAPNPLHLTIWHVRPVAQLAAGMMYRIDYRRDDTSETFTRFVPASAPARAIMYHADYLAGLTDRAVHVHYR